MKRQLTFAIGLGTSASSRNSRSVGIVGITASTYKKVYINVRTQDFFNVMHTPLIQHLWPNGLKL